MVTVTWGDLEYEDCSGNCHNEFSAWFGNWQNSTGRPTTTPPQPSVIPEFYSWFNTEQEVLNMTEEQLLRIVLIALWGENKRGFFHQPDLFGVPLSVEDDERWHTTLHSATTREQARQQVVDFVNMQSHVGHTIDFIGENNFYYTFRLAYWRQRAGGTGGGYVTWTRRVVVYNSNYVFTTFEQNRPDFRPHVYELRALDCAKIVTQLLDLRVSGWAEYGRLPLILFRSETTENAAEFIYTYYVVDVSTNFGSNAVASLTQHQILVDKVTGVLTQSSQVIKTTEIPGTENWGQPVEMPRLSA
jgi:hypothetical protein